MDHQVGCWDSVLLENESENCFISNLNLRFKRDIIYVSICVDVLKQPATTATARWKVEVKCVDNKNIEKLLDLVKMKMKMK